MHKLPYLQHYPKHLQEEVSRLIAEKKLSELLLRRYPKAHGITTDKELYAYVQQLKNNHMKKSDPVNKVLFDSKIHVINNALGTHTFVSRIQGSKLKAKSEIRIATLFKSVPVEFLKMITVHELAHIKEKSHNKAFYNLCEHMEPHYHQLEFDLRLYLTHIEFFGKLWQADANIT